MRKGISAVMSTVILLMVTISLAACVYIYMVDLTKPKDFIDDCKQWGILGDPNLFNKTEMVELCDYLKNEDGGNNTCKQLLENSNSSLKKIECTKWKNLVERVVLK